MSHPDTTREYGVDESPLIPDPDTQEQDECQCALLHLKPWYFDPATPSDGHGEHCPMNIPTK